MNRIQELHQQAMDLAEVAFTAKLRGDTEQASQLNRQAFEKEAKAAALLASNLDAEPTRSVLYRSAASFAVDCGELQTAERLITTALAENPPQEIAEELKDLFIQINLQQYFERRGIPFNEEKLNNLMAEKRSS